MAHPSQKAGLTTTPLHPLCFRNESANLPVLTLEHLVNLGVVLFSSWFADPWLEPFHTPPNCPVIPLAAPNTDSGGGEPEMGTQIFPNPVSLSVGADGVESGCTSALPPSGLVPD